MLKINKYKTEIHYLHKYSNPCAFEFQIKTDNKLFTNDMEVPLVWP